MYYLPCCIFLKIMIFTAVPVCETAVDHCPSLDTDHSPYSPDGMSLGLKFTNKKDTASPQMNNIHFFNYKSSTSIIFILLVRLLWDEWCVSGERGVVKKRL